jgi:hypothetical protein
MQVARLFALVGTTSVVLLVHACGGTTVPVDAGSCEPVQPNPTSCVTHTIKLASDPAACGFSDAGAFGSSAVCSFLCGSQVPCQFQGGVNVLCENGSCDKDAATGE